MFAFLCGGKGQRFQKETPDIKPTMNILGRPMYVWVLDSLIAGSFIRDSPTYNDLLVITNKTERSNDIHRRIRKNYEKCFSRVSRFQLPFDTEGPAQTAFMAACFLSSEYDESSSSKPTESGFWVMDNDVIHDEFTQFAFSPSDHRKVVKIVVSDLRDSSEVNNTVSIENDSPFVRFFHSSNLLDGRTMDRDPGLKTPYCHVVIDKVSGKVTGLHEKSAVPDAPFVLLGAYGFSSVELFKELYARHMARCVDSSSRSFEASLSDLVMEAVVSDDCVVEPVLVSRAFTVGTPQQIRRCFSSGVLSLAKSPPLTWVFDLDETLVTLPDALNDYSTCKPYEDVANLVRTLFDHDHRIIIHTARRMQSLQGNVEEIERQTRKITEDNLQLHNIPYHELVFGKPLGDVYVDDRSCNPRAWTTYRRNENTVKEDGHPDWLTASLGYGWNDTLSLGSAHHWKTVCPNVRVNLDTNRCIKLSQRPNQLVSYAKYLSEAPEEVRGLLPQLYKIHDNGDLEMEWIDGVSLSTLHTWGLLSCALFTEVLETMSRFHACDGGVITPLPSRELCMQNYLPKLRARIDAHKEDFYSAVLDMTDDEIESRVYPEFDKFFSSYVPQSRRVIHGDFWLGNLIWQPRLRLPNASLQGKGGGGVRAIDTRGALGDVACFGGDCVYDYAKLYQSLAGFDMLLKDADTAHAGTAPPSGLSENAKLIDMLEEHVYVNTDGAVDIYHVHMIACALLFGCAMFHRDRVQCRPESWKNFLFGMLAYAPHMSSRAQAHRQKKREQLDETDKKRTAVQKKNKVAVVLRGIARHTSYVHQSGKRVDIDFRSTAESIKKNVINDLENRGRCTVQTFLITYDNLGDVDETDLINTFRPKTNRIDYLKCQPEQSNQRDLFKHALEVVKRDADPDTSSVIIIRFDTEIKIPITELNTNPDRINFLWKERPARSSPSQVREIDENGRLLCPASKPLNERVKQQWVREKKMTSVKETIATDRHVAPPPVKAAPVCDIIFVFPFRFMDIMREATRRLATPSRLHGIMGPLCQVLEEHEQKRERRGDFPSYDFSLPRSYPIHFVMDDETCYESNTDVLENPVYHIVRGNATKIVSGHTAHIWKKMLGNKWRRI